MLDVKNGMEFFARLMRHRGADHDWTKIHFIDQFHKDLATVFKNTSWWEMHQEKE
jgi:hypothetical protein